MSVAFGVFAIVAYAAALAAIVWGVYIAYLLTKALRKYLRS